MGRVSKEMMTSYLLLKKVGGSNSPFGLVPQFRKEPSFKSFSNGNKLDLHENERAGEVRGYVNGVTRRIVLTRRQKATHKEFIHCIRNLRIRGI